MTIYAIIQNNEVINLIDYETEPTTPPASFPDGTIAVSLTGGTQSYENHNGKYVATYAPYPSWSLVNNVWVPPVPYPNDANQYNWDEETKSWVII
jgi:hypothetical protein